MDLQFGDIQETALITLAIRASETTRPNARIKDQKAKEIIDTLGVDVSRFDPFMSHEGVVARTIMYREELKKLVRKYPDAVCINLGCGFDDKFSQVVCIVHCYGKVLCPCWSYRRVVLLSQNGARTGI